MVTLTRDGQVVDSSKERNVPYDIRRVPHLPPSGEGSVALQGGRRAGLGGTGRRSVHDEGRQHASSLRSRQPGIHKGPEGGARKVKGIRPTDTQTWTVRRPRIEANTPLVIDVHLLYVPGRPGSKAAISTVVPARQDWMRRKRSKSESEDGRPSSDGSLLASNSFVNKSSGHKTGLVGLSFGLADSGCPLQRVVAVEISAG